MAQDNQLPEELAQHPEPSPDEMAEFAHWFGVECEVDAIDQEIKELHAATAATPLEIRERKRALTELTAQRGRLRAGVEGVSTPLPEPTRSEPAEPVVPPIAPPTPKETKVQRQDRRLQMCIDAGLQFHSSPHSRLPDGIAQMAATEGVTRQTFTEDVKKALHRKHQR